MNDIDLTKLFVLDRPGDETLAALVMEFCGTGEETSVFDLSQPFEIDGDCVATDGKALIRVPGLKLRRKAEGKLPDINGLMTQFWQDVAFSPLPLERLVPHSDGEPYCPYCERLGICCECDGEGTLYTASGNSRYCPECSGNGFRHTPSCPLCHGDQNFNAWLDDSMGSTISARYSRMVREIPGVLYLAATGDSKAILFCGDGGIRAMVAKVG